MFSAHSFLLLLGPPNSTPSAATNVTGYEAVHDGALRGHGDCANERQNSGDKPKEIEMAQKVIDVVGTSNESFAKAAENAVAEAAKTVRGMKWARVAELEMELDGKK